MTDIDKLLSSVRERAPNYGRIYGNKETADDYLKITLARLLEDAPEEKNGKPTTQGWKELWAKRQPEYKEAVERKKDAYAKWKESETYVKVIFAQKDCWIMDQSMKKHIDRAHE